MTLFAAVLVALTLLVSVGAAVFAVQKAVGRRNAPRTVPVDLATVTEAVRRIGERLSDLERRGSERDAELADALVRFSRMTQRLAVRADRQKRAEEPTEAPVSDLDFIRSRRNGIR